MPRLQSTNASWLMAPSLPARAPGCSAELYRAASRAADDPLAPIHSIHWSPSIMNNSTSPTAATPVPCRVPPCSRGHMALSATRLDATTLEAVLKLATARWMTDSTITGRLDVETSHRECLSTLPTAGQSLVVKVGGYLPPRSVHRVWPVWHARAVAPLELRCETQEFQWRIKAVRPGWRAPLRLNVCAYGEMWAALADEILHRLPVRKLRYVLDWGDELHSEATIADLDVARRFQELFLRVLPNTQCHVTWQTTTAMLERIPNRSLEAMLIPTVDDDGQPEHKTYSVSARVDIALLREWASASGALDHVIHHASSFELRVGRLHLESPTPGRLLLGEGGHLVWKSADSYRLEDLAMDAEAIGHMVGIQMDLVPECWIHHCDEFGDNMDTFPPRIALPNEHYDSPFEWCPRCGAR